MFRRAKFHLVCAVSRSPSANRNAGNHGENSVLYSWPLCLRRWAAKTELLAAESVHQHVYQLDKLLAYRDAAALFAGSGGDVSCFAPLNRAADVATTMRTIQEPLLRLLLDVLADKCVSERLP